MRLARSLACVSLLAAACSKNSEPPQPTITTAPSITAMSTPVPSASASVAVTKLPSPPVAPTRPKLLRRVTPKKMTASGFLKEGSSNWVPALAVDKQRMTAWKTTVGAETPWIEATFDKPVKLWGVRTDSGFIGWKALDKYARAKNVQLKLDGVDTYELALDKDAHAADFVGLDRSVTTVRLSYPETYPGEPGAPFAITEMSFWVDAETAPSVPRDMVEKEVEGLGGDVAKAKALLLRFGVVPRGDAESATAELHPPLGNDVSVLEVHLGSYAAYVFVGEVMKDGMKRLVGLDSEIVDQADASDVTMKTAAVHDLNDEHDVVLTWKVLRENKPAQFNMRVISLARGAVEKIAEFSDEREPRIDVDKPKDNTFDIELQKTEQKPLWRTHFDDRAYYYW